MKLEFLTNVYENKLPQLKSRQSAFPSITELNDGSLACCFTIGEAFESVDGMTYICLSKDGGKTWSEPKNLFKQNRRKVPITYYGKVSSLENNELICFGYAFPRPNKELPLGNPKTGGLLEDFVFYSLSKDNGITWSKTKKITSPWGSSTEASAPMYVLKDGTWISPITGFPNWKGENTGKVCGRVVVSDDKGKTWNSNSICTDFNSDNITCYEQRLCQLEDGKIVVISWNENVKTGERLPNHFTVSNDNGKTFSEPKSTGIMGQASSICAIGGNKILALHSRRRDTDRPGIYGYIVEIKENNWAIKREELLWEPSVQIEKDNHSAEIFSYLKFGQPSAVKLKNGKIIVTFWYAKNGEYKVAVGELEL